MHSCQYSLLKPGSGGNFDNEWVSTHSEDLLQIITHDSFIPSIKSYEPTSCEYFVLRAVDIFDNVVCALPSQNSLSILSTKIFQQCPYPLLCAACRKPLFLPHALKFTRNTSSKPFISLTRFFVVMALLVVNQEEDRSVIDYVCDITFLQPLIEINYLYPAFEFLLLLINRSDDSLMQNFGLIDLLVRSLILSAQHRDYSEIILEQLVIQGRLAAVSDSLMQHKAVDYIIKCGLTTRNAHDINFMRFVYLSCTTKRALSCVKLRKRFVSYVGEFGSLLLNSMIFDQLCEAALQSIVAIIHVTGAEFDLLRSVFLKITADIFLFSGHTFLHKSFFDFVSILNEANLLTPALLNASGLSNRVVNAYSAGRGEPGVVYWAYLRRITDLIHPHYF